MPISRKRRLLLAAAGALPFARVQAEDAWDEVWDVIVVGAGAAGLSAAIAAREAGASVLVLEKMAAAGGNSALCTGDMAVCGSPVQKALGFADSPEQMADDICREGVTSDRERALCVSRGARRLGMDAVDRRSLE